MEGVEAFSQKFFVDEIGRIFPKKSFGELLPLLPFLHSRRARINTCTATAGAGMDERKNFGKLAADAAPALIKAIGEEPRGRGQPPIDPGKYQAEIVTRLCAGESLPMICADPALPSLRTVNTWIATDPDFADAVAGGRAIGVNTLMDAAYSIASGHAHSTGSIERDKLLCSVIKWIVSKRDPDNAPSVHLYGHAGVNVVISKDDADWH